MPTFAPTGDATLPTFSLLDQPYSAKATAKSRTNAFKSAKNSSKKSVSTTTAPLFVPTSEKSTSTSVVPTLSASPTVSVATSVPGVPTAPIFEQTESPAVEFPGKPRWQTPLRVGKWPEAWEGARELGTHLCVRSAHSSDISVVIRTVLAEAVVTYVGPHLPTPTVEKWLCLLCDYLELNVDEQILVICLLRKYAQAGGRFIGEGDWARPQRWECVIAIACYLAVLLSEEFPGRTAMDLRELLGTNFRFGIEQIAFLKAVDWRICVTADQIEDVKSECHHVLDGDDTARERMRKWFGPHARDVSDSKRWADLHAESHVCKPLVEPVVIEKKVLTVDDKSIKVGKKRTLSSSGIADDSVVPRYVVPRIDPTAAAAAAVAAAHVQAQAHATAQVQLQAHARAHQLHAQMAAVGAVPAAFIPTISAVPSLSGVPTVPGVGAVPTMGAISGVPHWTSRW